MPQNYPNHPPQEYEIDLKELLNLLIKSKKFIILITLIFIAVATFYTTVLKKPVYESESVIELNLLLFPNEGYNLSPEINYYYPEVGLRKVGHSLLILQTRQNSKELSEIILTEAIDFISATTENQLEQNLERMNFIDDELLKLSQESNSQSESFNHLELIHQLTDLKNLKIY